MFGIKLQSINSKTDQANSISVGTKLDHPLGEVFSIASYQIGSFQGKPYHGFRELGVLWHKQNIGTPSGDDKWMKPAECSPKAIT
jgi:hypothetical protein